MTDRYQEGKQSTFSTHRDTYGHKIFERAKDVFLPFGTLLPCHILLENRTLPPLILPEETSVAGVFWEAGGGGASPPSLGMTCP